MHLALCTEEIISQVFEKIDLSERRRSMLSCLLVCKAWHESAIRILWGNYANFDHLLRLQVCSKSQLMKNPSYILKYARYIRSVHLAPVYATRKAIGRLFLLVEGICFLPSLENLDVSIPTLTGPLQDEDMYIAIKPILKGHLKKLTIRNTRGSSLIIELMLHRTFSSCQMLHSLDLGQIVLDDLTPLRTIFSQGLPYLTSLQELTLKFSLCDQNTLLAASRLPKLSSFHVKAAVNEVTPALYATHDSADEEWTRDALAVTTPGFPSLRSLDIQGRINTVHLLLLAIPSIVLETLNLIILRPDPDRKLLLFPAGYQPSNLQRLSIRLHIRHEHESVHKDFLLSSLAYGVCPELRSLEIRFFNSIELCDDDVLHLVTSFPKLEELLILWSSRLLIKPKFTTVLVPNILVRCPNLRELALESLSFVTDLPSSLPSQTLISENKRGLTLEKFKLGDSFFDSFGQEEGIEPMSNNVLIRNLVYLLAFLPKNCNVELPFGASPVGMAAWVPRTKQIEEIRLIVKTIREMKRIITD